MANNCSNSIRITGDEKQIETLTQLIKDQDKDFIEEYTLLKKGQYYGLVTWDLRDSTLYLLVDSKWTPPLETFESLSQEYEEIEIELEYSEPGCEIFGVAKISNGSTSIKDKDPFSYYEEYDDFKKAKKEIESLSQEEFISTFAAAECLEEAWEDIAYTVPGYNYLDRVVAQKISNNDLALFVNYQWADDTAEESYKERLKNLNKSLTH